MDLWNVWCPRCGAYTTLAPSPKKADFSPKVKCNCCGRTLNAKNGKMSSLRRPVRVSENPDLLAV